jgi:hypothetical protein
MFKQVYVLNKLFHLVTPVRLTLKSVDGLGAVDTRKRPDFWGQILTLHTACALIEVSGPWFPVFSEIVHACMHA